MSTTIKYNLDPDTQEELETVLNWAQELIDLQKDDDTAEEMIATLLTLADKFGVQRSVVHVEEDYNETTGVATLTIRTEAEEKKPKLTVVSDNSSVDNTIKLEEWIPDNDDKQ